MEKNFSIVCFFILYAKVNKQFGEKNFFFNNCNIYLLIYDCTKCDVHKILTICSCDVKAKI